VPKSTNQFGGVSLEVIFQGANACHLRFNGFLALLSQHLVLDQSFSQLDNLNVSIIDLPNLAFGQWGAPRFRFHFNSLKT
jgi:hypothetical protein